jgi:DNA-directed RNA polymerase specialized sigma24 family protein
VTDPAAQVDLRDALVRLLDQLPPRQRAVIVARYWEQLTEAETAAVLGCSAGTVKSATSRGLRRLRELSNGGLGDGALGDREPGDADQGEGEPSKPGALAKERTS